MSSSKMTMNGHKDNEIQQKSSDFAIRHNTETSSVSKNGKGKDHNQDQETMELYSKAKSQEKEIQYLREQIALASIKESQSLNEKYALERRFYELRMALDEKQNEAITSASNELASRKGYLELNLNMLNELKATEDEKHIFTSSMLGILGEYGVLPHVTNASALANSIKHLHDQLQLKIRTSHARLQEFNFMIGNNGRNVFDKEVPSTTFMNDELPRSSMGVHGFPHYNQYIEGQHLEAANNVPRYVQGSDTMRMMMPDTDRIL